MSKLTREDQSLLRSARAGGMPTARDQERVKGKLLAQLALGAGAGTSATAAGASSAGGAAAAGGSVAAGGAAAHGAAFGVAAKIAVVLCVIGGAVGTGVVVTRTDPRTGHGAGAQTIANVASSPSAGASNSSWPPPRSIPTAATSAPAAATAGAVSAPIDGRAPSAPSAPARLDSSRAAAAPLPWPETAPPPLVAAGPAAPEGTTVPGVSPPATAVASPPVSPPAPPSGPSTVAAEVGLLEQANTALQAGDAARALALVDEHRSRFPDGVLAEEREAERVVILCALGRTEPARAAAQAFLQARPHSPQAGRVRASCGGR